MTRRSERLERRKQKRLDKKLKYIKQYDTFEQLAKYEHLYKAALKASNGVSWKASVQRYLINIMFRTLETHNDLYNLKDVRKGFIEFDINERGKTRHIKSVHFSERVVQKSLCSNVLYPIFTRSLIYDNGASQKNKGTYFAIKRLEKHLRNHYKKYGNNGYILLVDFKSFFENINHEILKKLYRKYISNEYLLKYIDDFVDDFGIKGLGLGSETSQLHAILYPSPIDHYIKEVLQIKGYGRYMDDSYIICNDKNKLKEIYKIVKEKYLKYDIKINEKKTHITDIKHGFTFLKTRFYLTDNGKIIEKPLRKNVTYERRKLKRQKKLVAKNLMNIEQIQQSLVSWNGHMIHKNTNKTRYYMNKLFS